MIKNNLVDNFSCDECKTNKSENELKYNHVIYYLCDDCYSEHIKEDETMEVA